MWARRGLVSLIVCGLVACGYFLVRGDEVVGGTPRAVPDAVGRLVLRQCDFDNTANTVPVDVDALRIGPIVRDLEGELLVVALSADRTVMVHCGEDGGWGVGLTDMTRFDKTVSLQGTTVGPRSGVVAHGYVAPDITRLEVDLPTGQTVRAVVRIGAFAMVCPGDTDDVLDIVTVRAYDRSATLRHTGTGLFP